MVQENSNKSNAPNNRVFVGKLSVDADVPSLKEFFSRAGDIQNVKIKRNTKKGFAYAFINFNHESGPQKALDLNGAKFGGYEIEVQPPKERVVRNNNKYRNNNDNNNNDKGNGNEEERNTGSRLSNRRRRVYVPYYRRNNNSNNGGGNNNRKNNYSEEKELSNTALFVSNLPYSYDDEKLRELFELSPNTVKKAYIVSRNGRSKGFGFIHFETEEAAKAALDARNKYNVEDREVNVKQAYKGDETEKTNSSDTLYVSNLPYKLTDEALFDLFKEYGISKAYVARTKKKRSKGFGFVVLSGGDGGDAEIAAKQEKIISEKNQFKVEDREIFVRAAYNSTDRHDTPDDNNANNNNDHHQNVSEEPEVKQIALYVSNVPFSVNSDDLASHFNDVKGFKSANIVVARRNQKSRGYGFVVFDNEENRDAALAVKKDLSIGDRPLTISIAHGKKDNSNNNNRRGGGKRRGPYIRRGRNNKQNN